MKQKLALIIQGPLESIGRTGKTMSNPFFTLGKGDIINFNCEKNIIKIINEFGNLFDVIILSCWKNDKISKDLIEFKKLKICQNESFEEYYSERYNKDLSPNFSGHNKYRQIFSTLKGVEKAASLNCDYVFKIRTDCYLNLKICIETIKKNYKFFNKRIAVPYKIEDGEPFLEDIYFSGNTQIIKSCLNSILNNYEIKKSVHHHIFYSWLFELNKYFHKKSIFFNRFPLYSSLTKYDKLLDKICWNFFFTPLSKDVWSSLSMRGENRDDIDHNFNNQMRFFYAYNNKKPHVLKSVSSLDALNKIYFILNHDWLAKYFYKKNYFFKNDFILIKTFRIIYKTILFPHLFITQVYKAIVFSNRFCKISNFLKAK